MDDAYRMDHRPPGPHYGAPLHALDAEEHGQFRPDVYDHPDYYGSGQTNREMVGAMRKARGNPEAPITIYRALPGGHSRIHTGDWVTTSAEYARGHGTHATDPDKDMPVIKAQVPAKHLWTSGDELSEFGYHGPDVDARVHFKGGKRAVGAKSTRAQTSTASMADVGMSVAQAVDKAEDSLGALQQAHAALEEARGTLGRATEGSSQADAPEANNLLGQALGSIVEVQQTVQAAIASAGGVQARLGGSSTKWAPPPTSQRSAANKVQTCPECEGTGVHPWAVRNPAGWAGTPCPRCDGAKTTKVPDWTPPKTSPAQQTAFDHPDWDTSRSQLLDVAKDRTPGTTIWRSEVRHKDHLDNPPSIGMHWTTNPDQVVIQGHDMEPDHHQVVWQGRLHDRDQAFPRSHPMWSGKHMSMDREAEVRLKPGSTVHVDRRYVHYNSTSSAAFAPRHPARSSGAWEAHDMDHHVPVAHGKGGYSDYSDVGIHHTAATMADAGLRWKTT